MELVETVELRAQPAAVFAIVEDLGRCPEWLSIVSRANRIEGDEPAWMVDLRGRIGPLSRAKRLRMQRTEHRPPFHVRFERVEPDGRSHSPWVLDAAVAPATDGSELTMTLHYGGALWVPMLDRMLRQEIEGSRVRLAELLSA
ncbi:MAG TPA: SRPBCC family protein [Acidimicrobiales bacterium]|nr:SRPBCC family protein [Acidimicrobiales bacterium]